MRGVGPGGDLVEFVFESRAVESLAPGIAARLARQSWSNNVRAGLTGELRLQDGRFFQVVEGRCDEVLKLAARILTDSRHCAIRVLAFRAVPARRFLTWTVSGFEPGADADCAPEAPVPANLRFLPARVVATDLRLDRSAS